MKLHLTVAGFETVLDVPEEDISRIYRPVLEALAGMAAPGRRRKIAFLAGPPGSGKSTCGAILHELGRQLLGREMTVLPMDGFHFPNEYLKTHFIERSGERIPLARIKGAPESFDLERFTKALELLSSGRELLWPIYDRKIHDVIPDQIRIPTEGIFIVEGNYLLMDEPDWRKLLPFANKRIFILEPEDVLLDRLMARHMRGGKSPEQAKEWVMRNDLSNIRRVLSQRLPSDIQIVINNR
jgi:pantothenate kinase